MVGFDGEPPDPTQRGERASGQRSRGHRHLRHAAILCLTCCVFLRDEQAGLRSCPAPWCESTAWLLARSPAPFSVSLSSGLAGRPAWQCTPPNGADDQPNQLFLSWSKSAPVCQGPPCAQTQWSVPDWAGGARRRRTQTGCVCLGMPSSLHKGIPGYTQLNKNINCFSYPRMEDDLIFP